MCDCCRYMSIFYLSTLILKGSCCPMICWKFPFDYMNFSWKFRCQVNPYMTERASQGGTDLVMVTCMLLKGILIISYYARREESCRSIKGDR